MVIAAITQELESLADPRQAAILQRFFKTGPGDYGEGDRFRGIRVPVLRRLVRKYRHLPWPRPKVFSPPPSTKTGCCPCCS